MKLILHFTPAADFNALRADEPYRSAGYASDGFIHCTQGADLMLSVANTFYRDAPGEFIVLLIDEDRLSAPVKYEPPAPVDGRSFDAVAPVLFPHIYGPINRDAIVSTVGLRRAASGAFTGYDRSPDEWEA
jgi:uncharacterized protein (DUF952 family)